MVYVLYLCICIINTDTAHTHTHTQAQKQAQKQTDTATGTDTGTDTDTTREIVLFQDTKICLLSSPLSELLQLKQSTDTHTTKNLIQWWSRSKAKLP
jgi:hypothetical protein